LGPTRADKKKEQRLIVEPENVPARHAERGVNAGEGHEQEHHKPGAQTPIEKKMVEVRAVGPQGAPPAEATANNHDEGIDDGVAQNPGVAHRRRRIGDTHETAVKGEGEIRETRSEEKTPRIAEEHLGEKARGHPEIAGEVCEESRDPDEGKSGEGPQSPREGEDEESEPGHKPDTRGQPVETIEKIDGVDEAEDGEKREGKRRGTEIERAVSEQETEITDLDPANDDRDQHDPRFEEKPHARARLVKIVPEPDAKKTEQQERIEVALRPARTDGREERGGENADDDRETPDEGHGLSVIFAGAVRMVDEPDAPGKRREKTRSGKRENKGDGRGRPENRPHTARASFDNRAGLRAWHLHGERAPILTDGKSGDGLTAPLSAPTRQT
jgi:hypothetical protein